MVDNSLQNNNYGLGLYSNSNLQNSTQNVGKTSSGEKELEQAIYLDLHVKVLSKWGEDQGHLNQIGYELEE